MLPINVALWEVILVIGLVILGYKLKLCITYVNKLICWFVIIWVKQIDIKIPTNKYYPLSESCIPQITP